MNVRGVFFTLLSGAPGVSYDNRRMTLDRDIMYLVDFYSDDDMRKWAYMVFPKDERPLFIKNHRAAAKRCKESGIRSGVEYAFTHIANNWKDIRELMITRAISEIIEAEEFEFLIENQREWFPEKLKTIINRISEFEEMSLNSAFYHLNPLLTFFKENWRNLQPETQHHIFKMIGGTPFVDKKVVIPMNEVTPLLTVTDETDEITEMVEQTAKKFCEVYGFECGDFDEVKRGVKTRIIDHLTSLADRVVLFEKMLYTEGTTVEQLKEMLENLDSESLAVEKEEEESDE